VACPYAVWDMPAAASNAPSPGGAAHRSRASISTPTFASPRTIALAGKSCAAIWAVAVDQDGVASGKLATGDVFVARCPAHIDRDWLRAAAKVAPVSAVFVSAQPSGSVILWGIFPGRAHENVVVDVRIRGRQVRIDAEDVQLKTEKAHLLLEKDGNVSPRGRDVTSHARRVNRVKGGAIRLN